MDNTSAKRPVHVGHNIQKFRLIRGLSQAGLAHQLEQKRNRTVSQQLVSDIEDRENIEDEELLRQIAEILEVAPEALKNLDLDSAINVIGNTFTAHEYSTQINQPYYPTFHQTFNPLDKLIELFEKEKAELKAEIEKLKKDQGKK
jgi:transcriptional regulator with XRE-family HTH domain